MSMPIEIHRLRAWQPGSLRVTAFQIEPVDVSSVDWWRALTGNSSESKNIRAGIGQLVEQGPIDRGVLQLQIQPVRIDWILLPKDDPESELFQDLGDFE